jgi:threonine dehydrogenase-like Zn-dependent dehydrogenase
MKAAIITSHGIRIEEMDKPRPAAGEVLVRSISCGVCEGEVYRYVNLQGSGSDEQLLLGHEGSGIIHEVGSGVDGWNPGDPVTTSLGGAYAEYFVVPADRLVRIPAGISPEWAVGEAVACCAYSAQNARIRPGDKIAVIGCGFMGMLIMAFVRHLYGAGRITAVEPIPWRLAIAPEYGADELASDAGELPADSYDVVIEAAGAPAALDAATRLVAEHGRLTIVGYHQSLNGMRSINMQTWNLKALEITSGHCRRPLLKKQALEQVLPLIAGAAVDLKRLVTPYPLQDIEQAFRDASRRKEGLMKAAIQFGA